MFRLTTEGDMDRAQQEFQFIYTEYKATVYRFALRVLRDAYLAEDAVQEVFLKFTRLEVLKKIEDMESPEVKAYITVMAKNVIYTMFNKRKRSEITFLQDELELIADAWDMEDVTELVINKFRKKEMAITMQKLPKNYEDILELKYYYQLSDRETAVRLNIKEATARKRLERARKLFRVRYLEVVSVCETF